MKLSSLLSRFRRSGAQASNVTNASNASSAPREAADIEPPTGKVKTFAPPREEKGENGNGVTMTKSMREPGSLETDDAVGFEVEASVQTDVGRVREINEDSGRFSRP